MPRVTISRWGADLVICVPEAIATDLGLREGEEVEIEVGSGDLVIRRLAACAWTDTQKAAVEICENARGRSLGGISIKDLINEGRSG